MKSVHGYFAAKLRTLLKSLFPYFPAYGILIVGERIEPGKVSKV